jgi:hypothetical protein
MSEINFPKQNSSSVFADSAIIAAVIAAFLGALSIVPYLLFTVYGIGGFGDDTMMDFVLAREFGLGADGAEPLFVVVTRFILVYGILWGPLTLVVGIIKKFNK